MEGLSVKRGHFKPSETHRSAPGLRHREREREGRGSQIPKILRRNTSSGSSVFFWDAQKASLPRTHTHTCVCAHGSLNTSPKNKKSKCTARKLQILCSLPSAISLPCSTIKVCLRLWGNFFRLHLELPHSAHSVTLYKLYQSCARFRSC